MSYGEQRRYELRFPTIYDRYIFVDFNILLDVLDQVCIWLAIMVPGTTTTAMGICYSKGRCPN
jgi:hypothetical protein